MSCGKNGKMKYLEEISPGDCFFYQNDKFILTSDFKVRDCRKHLLSISVSNGFPKWLMDDSVVEEISLYYIDNEKNIVPLKETTDDSFKNKNIY